MDLTNQKLHQKTHNFLTRKTRNWKKPRNLFTQLKGKPSTNNLWTVTIYTHGPFSSWTRPKDCSSSCRRLILHRSPVLESATHFDASQGASIKIPKVEVLLELAALNSIWTLKKSPIDGLGLGWMKSIL